MRPRKELVPLIAAATPLLLGSAAWVNAQEQPAEQRRTAQQQDIQKDTQKQQSAQKQNGKQTQQSQQRSAQDISHAVEDELYNDSLVSLDDVQVSTSGGVVSLTGEVDSLLAKERAAHIAQTVRGVQNVDNQLRVQPVRQMSAEDLESAISQALLADPATESFNVTVRAGPEGKVSLTGQAGSWAERELVERAAKGVSGVTQLDNRMEINYVSARPDSELVADIEGMLRWDAYVDDGRVDVQVDDGVVTLSGTVGSAAEKSRVETIAWTAGSKEVNAESLQVAGWARDEGMKKSADLSRASDEEIAEAVRNVLKRSPRVAASNLDVQVDEETVTLRGTVENLKAKREARQQAMSISGVEDVRDRMRVQTGEGAPNDQDIENRVVSALAINPITEAYQISVDVNGGVVDLTGHVDNWFERGTADDVAARVEGVREVDNDLLVSDADELLVYDPYVDLWSIYEYDWYTPSQPTIWRQDSAIAREVRDELWWSPFVDQNEIDVSVQAGVVTLTGTVDSFAERRAATENALEGGAAGVVNELEVQNRSASLTALD